MISSSQLQTLPELFNITLPDTLHADTAAGEAMVLGLWGPLIHHPPTHQQQLDSSSSSGRVLYLVLKCQSLYQSLNAVQETSTSSSLSSELLAQSQAIFKCATTMALVSQCLTLCTDLPLDRTSSSSPSESPSGPSPLLTIQEQSSQIISSFLLSLSLSCSQLTQTNQLSDETLRRKLTSPPSLCLLREFTQQLQHAHRASPSLRSLYSPLLLTGTTPLTYFPQSAFYLRELCLDSPSSSSPSASSTLSDCESLSFESFTKLLHNLLLAQQRDINPDRETSSRSEQDNGPYLIEWTQICLSYIEPFYRDQVAQVPHVAREIVRNLAESPTATFSAEQESLIGVALERYRLMMAESTLLPVDLSEREADSAIGDERYQGNSGNS
jgi:hypothetical protein